LADAAAVVLILVTAGSRDEAERLGEGLVEARLAACGSVIPTVHSFYHWEGKLQREHEALLLVKTSAARAAQAQEYLREHHTYELPEILQVDVSGGSEPYLSWLLGEVQGSDIIPATTE
jgi:periplasmic divalent cation tolerance protein